MRWTLESLFLNFLNWRNAMFRLTMFILSLYLFNSLICDHAENHKKVQQQTDCNFTSETGQIVICSCPAKDS